MRLGDVSQSAGGSNGGEQYFVARSLWPSCSSSLKWILSPACGKQSYSVRLQSWEHGLFLLSLVPRRKMDSSG